MGSVFASSSSSSSFDLTVGTSSGLEYDIAYLSDLGHGLAVVRQVLKVQLVNGQVSLAWSMGLCTAHRPMVL